MRPCAARQALPHAGRGDEVIKSLERLRNNLAHTQDIIVFDWQTIVAITENLERLIAFGVSGRS